MYAHIAIIPAHKYHHLKHGVYPLLVIQTTCIVSGCKYNTKDSTRVTCTQLAVKQNVNVDVSRVTVHLYMDRKEKEREETRSNIP